MRWRLFAKRRCSVAQRSETRNEPTDAAAPTHDACTYRIEAALLRSKARYALALSVLDRRCDLVCCKVAPQHCCAAALERAAHGHEAAHSLMRRHIFALQQRIAPRKVRRPEIVGIDVSAAHAKAASQPHICHQRLQCKVRGHRFRPARDV
jgi:hypothetical protein